MHDPLTLRRMLWYELPAASYTRRLADGVMTAEQVVALKRLTQAAYELDAFKPNLTASRQVYASRC